jgi:hypothetical protein
LNLRRISRWLQLAKAETFDDVGDLSGLIEAGEKALEDKSGK